MVDLRTIWSGIAVNLMERLEPEDMTAVKQALFCELEKYDISEKTQNTEIMVYSEDLRAKCYNMFLVSKKIEGCTNGTINYYRGVINRFYTEINKDIQDINADDIRLYIAKAGMLRGISKTSQQNELRVLKSFFNWTTIEGYTVKNPTAGIKQIKTEKRIKKPFSETEIEILRQNVKCKRDLAIIDFLFSTGCRVSELVAVDISDISGDEVVVFGKGEKERYVYLNARSKLSIESYIAERNDREKALFVSSKAPYNRLTKGAVELIIRNLGKKSGIPKTHPHRFRRTCATIALNRGMPIEQVSQMLGHAEISTTTIYAKSERENVKISHKKYVV